MSTFRWTITSVYIIICNPYPHSINNCIMTISIKHMVCYNLKILFWYMNVCVLFFNLQEPLFWYPSLNTDFSWRSHDQKGVFKLHCWKYGSKFKKILNWYLLLLITQCTVFTCLYLPFHDAQNHAFQATWQKRSLVLLQKKWGN